MKYTQIAILLCSCLFTLVVPAEGPGERAVANLEFDEVSYSVLQPVTARFDLRNESDDPIRVVLGDNIRLEVEGVSISPSKRGVRFSEETVLEPGESLSKQLLLDDWYRFEAPGRYPVRVVLHSPPLRVEATQLVTITPRDPKGLRTACDRLASWAVSYDSEIALIGGRALKNVADEACLDPLTRALNESFHAKEGAIAGLARVGSASAFRILSNAWDDLRWDQQMLAMHLAARYEKEEDLQAVLLEAGKSNKPSDPKEIWNLMIPSWSLE